MAIEREFLPKANAFALQARGRMGLAADSHLCPFIYTQRMGLEVLTVSKLMKIEPKISNAVLSTENRKPVFSAATLLVPGTQQILGFVVNDNHGPQRQKSNLAHEWGHIFMGHQPQNLLTDRNEIHSKREEEEADAVGFAMLMTDEMCFMAAKAGLTDQELAETYEVSLPVVRLRMNRSRARKLIEAAA